MAKTANKGGPRPVTEGKAAGKGKAPPSKPKGGAKK